MQISNVLIELYTQVFNKESNKIPLLVKVPNEDYVRHSCIDCMNDPQKVIEDFYGINKYTLQVKSDLIPFIESNFLENLVPSFFGAKTHIAPGGSVDIIPPFTSVLDVGDLNQYHVDGKIYEQAKNHLFYLVKHFGDKAYVGITRFMSPLDYGVVLCGGNFYMDLLLYPEESMAFLNKIVDLTLEAYLTFKEITGQPINACVTVRGAYFPGLRLTGDSIVNLSPDHIKTYLVPLFERFTKETGKLMLHYCCTPAPSGHVISALSDCNGLVAVDNWQGYDTFFTNNEGEKLQDKIAICTDLSPKEVMNVEKLMTENRFFSDVKRKGGRGLTVTVNASSVEEGQQLYDTWTKYFVR